MQKLFKDKKKIVLVSLVAVLLVAAVIVGIVALNRKPAENIPPDTTASDTTSDANVNIPEIPDNSDTGTEESQLPDEIEDDGNALKPDESILPAESKTHGNKANTNNAPASEVEPPQSAENESGGGIVIGDGGNQPEAYSCGCEKHHCNAPETHAYIQNLELEGCPFCGSHLCPSFYTTDEWGGACPDATKCPHYNEKDDPIKYCQTCKKKNGDGSGGTCTQYINVCNCPLCGEWVESKTCHTCG